MSFFSISAVKQANAQHGHHFFERGAMRFFKSRILPTVYGGRYFVTSEQFNSDTPRRYTVRRVEDNGAINTVGEFQAFPSSRAARAECRRLAKEDGAAYAKEHGLAS